MCSSPNLEGKDHAAFNCGSCNLNCICLVSGAVKSAICYRALEVESTICIINADDVLVAGDRIQCAALVAAIYDRACKSTVLACLVSKLTLARSVVDGDAGLNVVDKYAE